MGDAFLDENTLDDVSEQPTEVAPPPALSFTRGMNPRAAVAWVRHHHGEPGVRQLLAALPPDVVQELGVDLRPGSMTWVTFSAQARLLATIDLVFGKGDYKLLREVGRFMALKDFPRVAKPVAMLLSPGLFVDMSVKIWRLYNSHGSWEVLRGRREIQASRFRCPEHHPAFCEGTMGWVEGAMLFCGAIDVVATEERCAARGGTCCSIRVRWAEAKDSVVERRPRPPT